MNLWFGQATTTEVVALVEVPPPFDGAPCGLSIAFSNASNVIASACTASLVAPPPAAGRLPAAAAGVQVPLAVQVPPCRNERGHSHNWTLRLTWTGLRKTGPAPSAPLSTRAASIRVWRVAPHGQTWEAMCGPSR